LDRHGATSWPTVRKRNAPCGPCTCSHACHGALLACLGCPMPFSLAHSLSISLTRSLSLSRLAWRSSTSRAPCRYGLASLGRLAPTSSTATIYAPANLVTSSSFRTASSSCCRYGRRCRLLPWPGRCWLQPAELGPGTAMTRVERPSLAATGNQPDGIWPASSVLRSIHA
jgi:hypothetical protein